MDGEANLTIGTYVITIERNLLFIPSIPYFQSNAIFSFKETIEYASSMSRIVAPLDLSVWITILIFICLAIIIILSTKKLSSNQRHFIIGGHMNRTPILNMIHIVFEGGIANKRMLTRAQYFGTFSRSLTIIWIMSFLVLRSSYQSSLYRFLQNQRLPSPYDTVEKIKNSECTIAVTESAVQFLEKSFDKKR